MVNMTTFLKWHSIWLVELTVLAKAEKNEIIDQLRLNMDTIKLSIVTPNGTIFNGDVKLLLFLEKREVRCSSGHSSLVSTLTVGVIIIEKKILLKQLLLTGDMLK